jgi:hypothetical protein
MRAGMAQGWLVSPVLFSLYDNDTPVPSRQVELAFYADETSIIATSRNLALLCQVLGIISRWPKAVEERMEERYQLLEEQCDGRR